MGAGMADVMSNLASTALSKALGIASEHLKSVREVERENISGCLKFLEAASAAVTGLESEVDEILIDAKTIGRFGWDNEHRGVLHRRLDSYLNKSQLQDVLNQAVHGLDACLQAASRDAAGFFQLPRVREDKLEATDALLELLSQLRGYLRSLSDVSGENFIGPSGLNLPELLSLQRALTGSPDGREDVIRIAEECQIRRRRHGIALVGNITRMTRELINAFRLGASAAK
jgi:hypothetical protein